MIRHSILFFLFICSLQSIAQKSNLQQKLDSIESLRKLSRNTNLDIDLRLIHAQNALDLSEEVKIDTTKLKSGLYLSYTYLDMDKIDSYKKINLKNLKLATKLNDSATIANLNYGLGYSYSQGGKTDSAYYYYYNAEKFYNALGDIQNEGEILLNIASIQETNRDYIGCEETAIRAISLVETLPEDENNLDTLWSLYNLLAIVSERLEFREKAIENYEKCLEIAGKMENPLYYQYTSKNNMGFTFRENGSLDKALNTFEELLNDKRLFELDVETYILVLGNAAYTRHLLGENIVSVEEQFKEGYKLSDSIEDPVSKVAILGDMSQFYYNINRKDEALKLSKENYAIAKKSNMNDEVLKSLKLMAKIEGGNAGKVYLNKYISLSDSLVKGERENRNKLARIRFDVGKIEEEKEQLSRQKSILTIVLIALLVGLIFIYIIISQRAKNRKLKFIQTQQEANEEIYNLMLAQQDKVEEGRTHEKKRISEELHDGILGKLFGTRLSLDSLNLVQTEEAAKSRSQYIDQLKTIETEIRKISHDLNSDFVANSSFIDIIKALVETQTTAYNLKYEFSNDDDIDWEEMPNKTKIHIYRMLQETMQNIYKHANASLVKISFQLKNNVILCTIQDDGSGFNVNKARKGIGLKNIDSRVNDIGGKAEVYSEIDIGTTFKIFIPVK